MFLDNLSTSVLRLCDKYKLTYEAASERCNISSRYFGDIARRKTSPSISTLEKLCNGFGATPNDLLTDPGSFYDFSFRQPMKVTEKVSFSTIRGVEEYPVCPQCKVTMERERQSFCDRCGQKLDWSEMDL